MKAKLTLLLGRIVASPAARAVLVTAAFALFSSLVTAAPPACAAGWDPQQAAETVLKFIRFIIIVAAAALCVQLVLRSLLVPAVITLVIAAILYVCLDSNILQYIGTGIKDWLGMGGSSGGGGGGAQ